MSPQGPVRKIAPLSFSLLILGALFERLARGNVPPGAFLTLFEVVLGLTATGYALRSNRPLRKLSLGRFQA